MSDSSIPHTEIAHRQHTALSVLYAALTVLAIWVVHEFVPAVLWAGVLSIALWPLFERIENWPLLQGRPRLTAAVLVLLVAIVFVVPLVFGVVNLTGEVHNLFLQVQNIERNGLPPPDWLAKLPFGSQQVTAWWRANLADPHSGGALLGRLPRNSLYMYGSHFGKQLVHALVTFGFMLMVMFFVFAAGPTLRVQLLRAARRAFGDDGASLATRMAVSVRGTVSGLVLVGLGEGVLLGVAYFFTGVPHVVLLAALSAVAAMLPFCAPVIFILAALYLLAQGTTGAAIALVVVGFLIVMVAEHFIRPMLIGGSSRLPFLLVLFGILGGFGTLGLLGLFVGPALMTILMVLWQDYAERK
ncbi:MAG: AI-2E family transporter [Janthinobacterium lividum]